MNEKELKPLPETCEHETNYYVEPDAPIVFSGGRCRYVTYRCYKCGRQIYKEYFWEEWKVVESVKLAMSNFKKLEGDDE